MDRRRFVGGLSGGFIGLLFSRDTEASSDSELPVSHELVDRGLSNEEMAQRIINSKSQWVWVKQNNQASESVVRSGSIDSEYANSVDISDPDLRTIHIWANDSCKWSEEYWGRLGSRWFLLG